MKICMMTTNPVDFDSRILQEAEALSSDHKVIILARNGKRNPHLLQAPYKIKRFAFNEHLPYQLAVIGSMWRLFWASFFENPDVYHAHDLPGLICVWLAAVIKKKILIYDSHELWANHYHFANTRGLHWLFPFLEKILIKKVSKGITVNESLVEHLSKKYHKEFVAVYNYPKPNKISKPKTNLRQIFPGEIICLHIGSTGEGRGIEQLIEAAKILPSGIIIVLLGGDKQLDKLHDLINQYGLQDKVKILPFVPSDEVIATASQADIGLVLTQNISQSYYLSSPNKLYQYVSAELPILGSFFPEYKKVIIENNIGQVVDPANPSQIAKKIISLAETKNQQIYRKNLIGLAQKKYNWFNEARKLRDFYNF